MKEILRCGVPGGRYGRDDIRGRDTSEYTFGELEPVLTLHHQCGSVPPAELAADADHISWMRSLPMKDGGRQQRLLHKRSFALYCWPVVVGTLSGVGVAAGILAFC